jgi:predicted GTPase
MASGDNLRVGKSLESCTAEVKTSEVFTLNGQEVVLIDTPGFNDTNKTDTEILRLIARFLEST